MAKRWNKALAFALALCMCAGSMNVSAWATTTTETVDNKDGTTTEIETTTETTTDSEGNLKVVVTIEKSTDDTTNDGVKVDRDEKRVETTVTDENGEVVQASWEEDGTETKEWTEKDDGSEAGQPEVEVPLEPGKTTTGTATTTETTGNINSENGQTMTTITDRTVTATTSEVTTKVNDVDTGLVEDQITDLNGLEHVFDTTAKSELYHDNGHYGFIGGDSKKKTEVDAIWEHVLNEVMAQRQAAIDSENQKLVEKYDEALNKYVAGGSSSILNSDGQKVTEFGGEVTHAGQNTAENFHEMMDDELMLSAIKKVLKEEMASEAPDAEYNFVGYGDYSGQYVSKVKITYAKDEETGEYLVDDDGNYIVESYVKASSGETITVSGVPVSAVDEEYLASLGDIGDAETLTNVPYVNLKKEYIESLGGDPSGIYDQKTGVRAEHFLLMDKEGNTVYAYCIDLGTPANSGKWYKVANLEDNDYYASEEAEEHVRSIVMNGYWGTSDNVKEDGTYETGSLKKVKESLKIALRNGEIASSVMVPVKDVNGIVTTQTVEITEELIDKLTNGEALDMTQAAIWSYSNGMQGVTEGWNGQIIGGTMYGDHKNGNKNSVTDPLGMARMKVLYDWLVGLDTEETSTTVINDKNFVEDLQLTVKDKAKKVTESGEKIDYAENIDENPNNDIYGTELNFTLKFEPSRNKDDLLVYITYGDQTVVKRLAGKDKEGQNYGEAIEPVNGVYTIEGLTFSENSNIKFDLRLEGTQYLELGAYVYVSENGVGDSQTMVGIAEGTRNVDVSASVTINFNVDENNYVKTEREWHDESDPVREPSEDPEYPEYDPDEQDGDQDIPEEPVPLSDLVDIFDEEIPLASVPQTGVNNTPWSLMVAAGLALAAVLGKKNK